MGIAYRCDAGLGCTFIVWHGDVTPEQWSDHVKRMEDDPAFPPGPALIADLSTAGLVPKITPEVIDNMAGRWRAYAADLEKLQFAIIPNLAWDKARQFELVLEGSRIRTMVFNEPWTACSWLGVDANVVRPVLGELREALSEEPKRSR